VRKRKGGQSTLCPRMCLAHVASSDKLITNNNLEHCWLTKNQLPELVSDLRLPILPYPAVVAAIDRPDSACNQ
jgi:hypothetical protein